LIRCLPKQINIWADEAITLEDEIRNWDGKSKEAIAAVYQRYFGEKNFVGELIAFIDNDEALQNGATWLLKHHCENGGTFKAADSKLLFSKARHLGSWPGRLHFLQLMPYMPVKHAAPADLASFLSECLTDKNKFVRAWAYNGFHLLAQEYAEYQVESKQLIEQAMENEAASVRARIRNILRE
jgi:hypothetical protein